MLKFLLKMKRLDFMEGLMTNENDMLVPAEDEVDLLAQIDEGDHIVDAIIAAVGQGQDDM